MATMARALEGEGYLVLNPGYPSRKADVRTLAQQSITQALATFRRTGCTRLHVVTHSMGGILLRAFLAEEEVAELGHVVMLAPPNGGSELVDRLRHLPGFAWFNGPAGLELGTGTDGLPGQLGPAAFSVGIIAGSRCRDPFLSRLLPRPNDGKVSVERTRLAGMRDFLELPYGHTFLMNRPEIISQTVHFLKKGFFCR